MLYEIYGVRLEPTRVFARNLRCSLVSTGRQSIIVDIDGDIPDGEVPYAWSIQSPLQTYNIGTGTYEYAQDQGGHFAGTTIHLFEQGYFGPKNEPLIATIRRCSPLSDIMHSIGLL